MLSRWVFHRCIFFFFKKKINIDVCADGILTIHKLLSLIIDMINIDLESKTHKACSDSGHWPTGLNIDNTDGE